jgi:predicted P-loop ATPase
MNYSELHLAALAYAARGWAVFPVRARGKEPLTQRGFKAATTEIAQINEWWAQWPNANIGVACGEPSCGLLAIDLDIDEDKGIDGAESLSEWQKQEGITLPRTANTLTGRGGQHWLYRTERATSCRTGVLAGVDVRGDGGYIIVPPSQHPNGNLYAWECQVDDVPIACADGAVFKLINKGQHRQDREFNARAIVQSGHRNDALFRYACKLQTMGWDDDAVWASLEVYNMRKCKPPLEADELSRIIANALKYDKGAHGADTASVQMLSFKRKHPKRNQSEGDIEQCVDNCVILLEEYEGLGASIGFNELANQVFVRGSLPWDTKPQDRQWSNADIAHLYALMQRYGLMVHRNMDDALRIVAERRAYHPVCEWLDSLEWDGEERMETIIGEFTGATLDNYVRYCTRLFMFAAVARAYHPGIKFDHVVILVGEQGKGKSLFWEKMAHDPRWFNANFNTFESDKAAEKLRGVWIAEIPELAAIKRSQDVEAFKAFITARWDTYRAPYDKYTEQIARKTVLVGTANDHAFLVDKTGNRRFLPIEIHPERVPKGWRLEGSLSDEQTYFIDQCWAEAASKWHKMTKREQTLALTLTEDIMKIAIERQKDYTEDDPRVGIIERYLLYERDPYFNNGNICVAEICKNALDLCNPTRREINEIHAILCSLVAVVAYVGKQKCGAWGVQRAYKVKTA